MLDSGETCYEAWGGDRGSVLKTGRWAGAGREGDVEIFTGRDQDGAEGQLRWREQQKEDVHLQSTKKTTPKNSSC